jgi:outer membrane protein TolC
LLTLLACGCSSSKELYSLVVPEQDHFAVRQPEQIAHPPQVSFPPPVTVSNPAPAVVPKELSLDEAIRIALANAKVIRILAGTTAVSSTQTIYDPAISNTAIDNARAVFDPVLTGKSTLDHVFVPVPFLDPTNLRGTGILPQITDDWHLQASLSKRNVLGGTMSVNVDDLRSRFHPGIFPLSPENQSSVSLSYTQPLLSGAGISANVAPIVIARLDTERSYYLLKDSVQELVRSVIEAYWNVVFSRTDVWAKRIQVEQGDEAYQRADARKRKGLGSAGEVAQTRVSLLNFKANLIAAEANLLQQEDALRNLLGLPPTEPLRIAPVTPPTSVRIDPRWEETVKLAEVRRPDLIELQLILAADQQALIQARNQAQPQVDATMLYSWNNLEGRTPLGAGISSGDYENWSVGVNVTVPLGLRQSRAALRRVELTTLRDRANLEQGLHAAVHELSGTFRSLAQSYEQYAIYKQTRQAALENLEQQTADFRAGRSIYLNVLQAISDWGNSVSSEALALSQYNVQLAALERQTGTILETHGVAFFEERYRSLGPLGRLGPRRPYPEAAVVGPNAPRYPVGAAPADQQLERDRPREEPLAPPRAKIEMPLP